MRGLRSQGWSCVVALGFVMVGVTYGDLTETTATITATANGWDTRTGGYGCAPRGCVASNAIDDSVENDSRWSCNALVSEVEACELTMVLDEPQDIEQIRIALWKGDDRVRRMDVWVDGALVDTIESSGITEGYEAYQVAATGATTVVLRASNIGDNGWLSILGVKFMVDTDPVVSPPSPAPTSDFYVGCFNDMMADPVMTNVTVDDALTSEACAAICESSNNYYYALQRGNECWCAGCDLTNFGTNTDYDRHGEGTCNTPCAGDSSTLCGGDNAFSLFNTGTCADILVGPDIPADIANQIIADATGGFAGPGNYYLDGDRDSSSGIVDLVVLTANDDGTLEFSATFQRVDGARLPVSTAVFLYLDDDGASTDISLGQGVINPSTGDFFVSVSGFALGFSRVIFSFVVLDPAEALEDQGPDSVYRIELVNNGCASPLTITLTWSTDNTDIDLWVTEPGGTTVNFDNVHGDVGYLDRDNVSGFGPENYIVYSGLDIDEDAVLGDYVAWASYFYSQVDTVWTMTARVNGVVAWVEEGTFEALSINFEGSETSEPYTVTVDS